MEIANDPAACITAEPITNSEGDDQTRVQEDNDGGSCCTPQNKRMKRKNNNCWKGNGGGGGSGDGRGGSDGGHRNSLELAYDGVKFERRPCVMCETLLHTHNQDSHTHTHRPDCPRFFFQESYQVTTMSAQNPDILTSPYAMTSSSATATKSQLQPSSTTKQQQIVHHHVNGLAVVTVGDNLMSLIRQAVVVRNRVDDYHDYDHDDDDDERLRARITSIEVEFTCKEGVACNAGQTRKKHAKMLKKGPRTPQPQKPNQTNKMTKTNDHGDHDGIVTPTTQIALVTIKLTPQQKRKPSVVEAGGETTVDDDDDDDDLVFVEEGVIPFYACVWGTIVELNPHILRSPNLLLEDPLMDGHLAIIHPTGTFPPPRPQPPVITDPQEGSKKAQ